MTSLRAPIVIALPLLMAASDKTAAFAPTDYAEGGMQNIGPSRKPAEDRR